MITAKRLLCALTVVFGGMLLVPDAWAQPRPYRGGLHRGFELNGSLTYFNFEKSTDREVLVPGGCSLVPRPRPLCTRRVTTEFLLGELAGVSGERELQLSGDLVRRLLVLPEALKPVSSRRVFN